MVRTMAGTLIDVGAGRIAAAALPGILAARDRRAAGMTAPAPGLSLVRIFWELPLPAVAALKADAAQQFVVGIG
jgi:tRNA pseudouridine38-40 synthase